MPDRPTFVIIGANLAGGRAAEALRKEGFDGRVLLVGAEPDLPYERPPLSKAYVRGEQAKEKLFIADPSFYHSNEIELRLGARATAVDVTDRAVNLENGERVPFDRLLISTGGRVRRLQVPGAELEGVYYLRTIADSERIGAELREGRRVVVVGAGFIGAEVAASAHEKGLEVTLLEVASVPLERVLGREMGEVYAGIHRDQGVDLRTEEGIERIEGAGRAERAVTTKGNAIECDFVVVGVGIDPNTELAEGAGIAVDNGIVVDEFCQTNVDGIFAAGDVANFYNPILDERMRLEHWANAQNQGRAAALNMMGRNEPFAEVPWFWSDQYDLNMQYVGHASSWDEVVMRGSVDERKFSAFYLKDGMLRGALCANRFRDVRGSRELIKAKAQVPAEKLRDDSVDLKSMLPEG